jgi:hypothetical protein
MKQNRVHCDQCQNFTPPDFKISFNILKLKKLEKTNCSEGKKVMFRVPKTEHDYQHIEEWGYVAWG